MAQNGRAAASDARRALPSVDRLLQNSEIAALLAAHPRDLVVRIAREALAAARARIEQDEASPSVDSIAANIMARLEELFAARPARVINATGVILHTNLGRAPLSEEAIAAMDRVARGYSTLEFDLPTGQRGSRHEHAAELLRHVAGADDALVANNNAAAVLLVLAAIAAGKEVIISRGQLVEIGGGFRIPEVLRQSGATLVEVGTTNRTYLEDYAAAIGENTGALLRVHSSNFRVVGFVHEVPLEDLVRLGAERGVKVVDDLGSGCLLPTERYGLAHEPMVQESVRAGADLVCFSGDKLLGGPQAGIIVGKSEAVAALKNHPLIRALRPDKATLAALVTTLASYLRGDAEQRIPVWRMMSAPVEELERRGEQIATAARGGGRNPHKRRDDRRRPAPERADTRNRAGRGRPRAAGPTNSRAGRR